MLIPCNRDFAIPVLICCTEVDDEELVCYECPVCNTQGDYGRNEIIARRYWNACNALPLTTEVHAFATMMQSQLNANSYKGGWKRASELDFILDKLHESVTKITTHLQDFRTGENDIVDCIQQEQLTQIALRAADVGNYAMFIADILDAYA